MIQHAKSLTMNKLFDVLSDGLNILIFDIGNKRWTYILTFIGNGKGKIFGILFVPEKSLFQFVAVLKYL
jgi:hypothetical protein